MSERPDDERGGYPEEQPGSPQPSEDESPREGGKAPRRNDDQADDHDTATGNPHEEN